jgi:hypothetical protein
MTNHDAGNYYPWTMVTSEGVDFGGFYWQKGSGKMQKTRERRYVVSSPESKKIAYARAELDVREQIELDKTMEQLLT